MLDHERADHRPQITNEQTTTPDSRSQSSRPPRQTADARPRTSRPQTPDHERADHHARSQITTTDPRSRTRADRQIPDHEEEDRHARCQITNKQTDTPDPRPRARPPHAGPDCRYMARVLGLCARCSRLLRCLYTKGRPSFFFLLFAISRTPKRPQTQIALFLISDSNSSPLF